MRKPFLSTTLSEKRKPRDARLSSALRVARASSSPAPARLLLACARNQSPLVRFALASSVCSARTPDLRPALLRRHLLSPSVAAVALGPCRTAPPLSFPLLATRLLLSPIIEQCRPHCSIAASPASRVTSVAAEDRPERRGSSQPSQPGQPSAWRNVLCDV